jgi:hypothetical protein
MISPGGWKERRWNEDVVPPKKPLSKKTYQEMYMGRRLGMITKYSETMPWADYEKFRDWTQDWMTQ